MVTILENVEEFLVILNLMSKYVFVDHDIHSSIFWWELIKCLHLTFKLSKVMIYFHQSLLYMYLIIIDWLQQPLLFSQVVWTSLAGSCIQSWFPALYTEHHCLGTTPVGVQLWKDKSRSEPGNAPRIGIGHREVVCQK